MPSTAPSSPDDRADLHCPSDQEQSELRVLAGSQTAGAGAAGDLPGRDGRGRRSCGLADFEAEWGKKYPAIAPAWRRVWNEVVPFFAYPPQIRKMIYTTNAIEKPAPWLAQDHQNQAEEHSRPDEAATKLLYLALRNLGVHWKPAIEWRAAYAQFTIFFAERLPTTLR